MDLYNIITKIPYLIMLGVGLVLILQIYVGGLTQVSVDIDENSMTLYDQALGAERVQNLGDTRGTVNFSVFETGSDSCSLEDLGIDSGLEFRLSSPVDSTTMEDKYGVGCQEVVPRSQAFQTRILLANETHNVPATLYVYEN